MFDRPASLEKIWCLFDSFTIKRRILLVPDEPQVVDSPGDTDLTARLSDSALNYTHQ